MTQPRRIRLVPAVLDAALLLTIAVSVVRCKSADLAAARPVVDAAAAVGTAVGGPGVGAVIEAGWGITEYVASALFVAYTGLKVHRKVKRSRRKAEKKKSPPKPG